MLLGRSPAPSYGSRRARSTSKFPQIDDSEGFARFMLTEFDMDGETVMVAPGTGFYATSGMGKNEVRLAYVLEEEKLIRAARVLRAGLKAYVDRRAEATVKAR